MDMSERERRILAEIEEQLQRDVALAVRFDALNDRRPGPASRPGPPPGDRPVPDPLLREPSMRYACPVSRRELVWVIVVTVAFTLVLTSLSLTLTLARTQPASHGGPGGGVPTAPAPTLQRS